MKNKLFSKLIIVCLYFADTEFLSRSINFREANKKVYWIFKDLNKLWEDAFGREFFKPEYADQKTFLNDRLDYFGIIWKWSISGKLTNVYLAQIYKNNKNQELNQHLENYIRKNPKECLKLVLRVIKRRLKAFPKNFIKSILDKIDLKQARVYQESIEVIKSYLSGKKCGTAIGFNWSYQLNYFKPIMKEFVKNDVPVIYICESGKTEFVKKDYFGLYKVNLPTLKEVFSNRSLHIQYKDDLFRLVKRINSSKIDQVYKKFIIDKLLISHLKRYYKIRFFIDKYCRNVDSAFIFALSERFDFQRVMQITCQSKNIPTFTYEPSFNAADVIKQWFYFSEYVLFSNKRRVKLAQNEGFSVKRLFAIGSTLADYYVQGEDTLNFDPGKKINVLVLTKPKRKTASSNDPIIESTFDILDEFKGDYHCYIKPHIGDKDQYLRFSEKYKDKISIMNRNSALYNCVPKADILISCGMSGAILECLPSKKPIMVVDITKTSDKGLLCREDMNKIIPLFVDLESFESFFRKFLVDLSGDEAKDNLEIPQSIVDDFFYSLDGKTAQRVSNFVLSKV